MHGSALGGVVGKVPLGIAYETAHAGDDDDGGRSGQVAVSRFFIASIFGKGGLEQGEEGEDGEVNGCHIGVEDGGPGRRVFGLPKRAREVLG